MMFFESGPTLLLKTEALLVQNSRNPGHNEKILRRNWATGGHTSVDNMQLIRFPQETPSLPKCLNQSVKLTLSSTDDMLSCKPLYMLPPLLFRHWRDTITRNSLPSVKQLPCPPRTIPVATAQRWQHACALRFECARGTWSNRHRSDCRS